MVTNLAWMGATARCWVRSWVVVRLVWVSEPEAQKESTEVVDP